jgi:3-deoxy-7-phosphoheptulonate synthase
MIGRIAGQYAKPRSSEFTEINGKKIYTYKGDNINDYHDIEKR